MSLVNIKARILVDNKDTNDRYKFVDYAEIDLGDFEEGAKIEAIYLGSDLAKELKSSMYSQYKADLPIVVAKDLEYISLYFSNIYRENIYKLERSSLSDSVVNDSVDVFLKLIAILEGDKYRDVSNVSDYINVDTIKGDYLKLLCSLIGYKWLETLPANKQRESIKYFLLLRRLRGTKFALKNLIKVFGQSAESLYQATDISSVRVFDYTDNNIYGMFPGDIRLEIPEMSDILRNAVEEVRPAGTRLMYTYRLEMNPGSGSSSSMSYRPDIYLKLILRNRPYYRGWTRVIGTDLPEGLDTPLESLFCNQIIYYYRDIHNVIGTTQVTQEHSEPFEYISFLSTPGQTNVRGVIYNDSPILNDLVLYR